MSDRPELRSDAPINRKVSPGATVYSFYEIAHFILEINIEGQF